MPRAGWTKPESDRRLSDLVSGWQEAYSPPSKSAIFQARARLGSEPLAALFEWVAQPIGAEQTPELTPLELTLEHVRHALPDAKLVAVGPYSPDGTGYTGPADD